MQFIVTGRCLWAALIRPTIAWSHHGNVVLLAEEEITAVNATN